MNIRVKKTANFTTVSNVMILDDRVSMKAKGIWLYLMSKPDNWSAIASNICKNCTDKESSIYGGIKELVKYGYAERTTQRENGKIVSRDVTVYEEPKTYYTINPLDLKILNQENLNQEILNQENHGVINTDTNKNLNKINTDNNNLVQNKILDDEVYRLTNLLSKRLKENNYKYKPLSAKQWHLWNLDIDKMHRLDGYDWKIIEGLIEWSTQDSFWRQNVLSAGALRKHASRLYLKAIEEKDKKRKNVLL